MCEVNVTVTWLTYHGFSKPLGLPGYFDLEIRKLLVALLVKIHIIS